MRTEVLDYLKSEPQFRERKNKNKGICNLIAKKYFIVLPKDRRDDFITDILNADRYWRLSLKEFPNLRGADYETKDEVEQKYEMSIGYESGFNQKLKL